MFSRKYIGLAGALLAVTMIASPATSVAGSIKAKCQAEAKEHKIAKKEMGEFMKKCYAKHKKAKKEMKEKKEMKKEKKESK